MTFRMGDLFPCAVFFAEGRVMFGIGLLLMQLSLVFWPLAVSIARQSQERNGVERMLAELSETHRRPVDPYSRPAKRFRQLA